MLGVERVVLGWNGLCRGEVWAKRLKFSGKGRGKMEIGDNGRFGYNEG